MNSVSRSLSPRRSQNKSATYFQLDFLYERIALKVIEQIGIEHKNFCNYCENMNADASKSLVSGQARNDVSPYHTSIIPIRDRLKKEPLNDHF